MYYTNEELEERMKMLGMNNIPQNYWIRGIRSGDDTPDRFDDVIQLMKGKELILETTGTTNPGVSILQGGFKKYKQKGAAILGADKFYSNVWTFGKHLGKQEALLQRGAKVCIFRDGNLNRLSEEVGDPSWEYAGINFHCDQHNLNAADKQSNKVGGWSAGCQVCNNLEDYKKIIEACKNQKLVSYCLLNEFSI